MEMSKKGFSLIELLVVLAILTILMGLVVPKVGRMLDEAKEHKCRNNLRQLHVAVISYANDHSGGLPRAMSYETFDYMNETYYEQRGWISWEPPSGRLNNRWPSKKESKENGMTEDGGMGDSAKFGIENGTLYTYMNQSMEHYACPLIKKEKGSETYRTYAMNRFFHSPRNPSWEPRYLTQIGTAESFIDNPQDKKSESYLPEASKLLLFAEIEPGDEIYKHSGENDNKATREIIGDCCIDPTRSATGKDVIYALHRSPVVDKDKKPINVSLAVFLDGHIDKVFSVNIKGDNKGDNSAWFYARGLDPEKDIK